MHKIIYLLIPFLFSSNVYEYSLPAAKGGTINLSDYQGKKILIVNTAGNSDRAVQYAKLEELYEKYQDSLVVIAVPSNSFGNEPATDSSLYDHVTITYGATYPIAERTEVIGDSTCELYQWLSHQTLNGVMDNTINTDFKKFLIDDSGQLIGVFSSAVDPMSQQLQDAITGADQ